MAPLGSIETTASTPCTASRTEVKASQPLPLALSSASAAKSKARTSCPALTRFAAMPPPMLPSPMKAIFMLLPSLLAGGAGGGPISRNCTCGTGPPLTPSRKQEGDLLPMLPHRRTLFDESVHPFGLVFGRRQDLPHPAFEQ